MIDIQRVDYIRIPVTDMQEANHFYGEVLGLARNPNSPSDDWVEYETPNVTLAVMTPDTHDYEFTPLPVGTLALRVPDVADAKAKLEAADANLVHGSVNAGTSGLHQQLVFRPTPGLGRLETPVPGLYLASASAHPGCGVHGACGWNAARAALGANDRLTGAALQASAYSARPTLELAAEMAQGEGIEVAEGQRITAGISGESAKRGTSSSFGEEMYW